MNEERADIIRFIDSSYKPLFYLPDGENIVITRPDGKQLTRRCEFLDSYHLRVGREIFHIYEFAVKMEKAGNTCAPEKLPELSQMESAMLGGALKGWVSPAARVSSYDIKGNPIRHVRNKNRRPREAER